MPVPRYFLPPDAFGEHGIRLSGSAYQHAVRVLRLREGDRLIALDGTGTLFEARLTQIGKAEATAEILNRGPAAPEPRVAVTLAQAVPKGEKWDWVLQKATELGVRRIVPLVTERTVVKPREDKLERWRTIAQEAAEQSERPTVPEILAPIAYERFMAQAEGLVLLCYEREQSRSLRQVLEPLEDPGTLTVVVGPEGGFSEREVAIATERRAQLIGLGPRILRAETASLVVLSMLLYRYEL